MTTINIRLVLPLIACLAGASAGAQFINTQAASKCGVLLTGGSSFHLIDSDYDYRSLYIYDLNEDPPMRRKVYSVERDPFHHPKLSFSCEYIAFLEVNQDRSALGLRAITVAGQEKHFLPGVLSFCWGVNARGEDVLAYLAGVYPTEDESELPPSGEVWMLNIKTEERRMIHPSGFRVTWAEFDSSFYIEEVHAEEHKIRVSRYDLANRRLEETPYLGSTFSKGGTYYYLSDYVIARFRLYERSSNEDIAHEHMELLERLDHGLISPVGWISDTMLALSSRATAVGERATQKIIDFKSKQLWEVEPEVVGLTGPDGRDLIRLTKDGVFVRPFKDVARLVYPTPDEPDRLPGGAETLESE